MVQATIPNYKNVFAYLVRVFTLEVRARALVLVWAMTDLEMLIANGRPSN
jgi:hypothetical protein